MTLLPDALFVNLINSSLLDKLRSSSATNLLVLNALHTLPGEVPANFHSHLSDWHYNAGILTYQGHIYVPNDVSLHCSVVAQHHDHPTAGHPGVLKTRQLVTSEFWWPGLASYVCSYVTGCASCQQNKVNTHLSQPPLMPIPSSVTVQGHELIFSILHLLPLTPNSPLTFTVLIIFLTDTFHYIIW